MYILRLPLLLSFFAMVAVSALGQRVPVPRPTIEPEGEDIIRISSKLVLIDALVIDKDNKQVKDLSAEDFEIFQDGKRQPITTFSYVDGVEKTVTASPPKAGKKELPLPPVNVRSNDFGRVITFVVDDGNCFATIEGVASMRNGVKKFISEQMRPDDRVAIYRTRGGSSLLQLYTSNREVLRRVANKISWAPSRCSSAFEAARDKSTIKVTGQGATSFESEEDRERQKAISDVESDNQIIGSVGVLGFVVDRLKSLPQRKLVFFVSEGIRTGFGTRSYDALREVADKASRSSVVVYTLGAKGTTIPAFISAQDEVLPGIMGGEDDAFALAESRAEEERALNDGMAYLAYSTGGKFIRNRNFLDEEMEKVLEVETGYYILGYEPDSDSFDGKEFHRIEVRVTRPELKVSSRKGFIGRDNLQAKTTYRNAGNPLYQAIASPFAENAMDINLTVLVKNDQKAGSYVRTLFHIDGRDLTFSDEPDGLKKVVLNVVLLALDEKGRVVEEFNRSYPIRIPARGLETVRQNGLDYSTDMPIKRSGFFSLRLAVQDDRSKRMGSAGDYVEIPKTGKGPFFIGGLITVPVTPEGIPIVPKQRPVGASFAPVFDRTAASVRQYLPGSDIAYAYDIYNPKPDKATKALKLTSRFLLYKDGRLIKEGSETPVRIAAKADRTRIEELGHFSLDPASETGEYILQLIVTDTVSNKVSTQWIDLEVIE